jgi:hypothetical protein
MYLSFLIGLNEMLYIVSYSEYLQINITKHYRLLIIYITLMQIV